MICSDKKEIIKKTPCEDMARNFIESLKKPSQTLTPKRFKMAHVVTYVNNNYYYMCNGIYVDRDDYSNAVLLLASDKNTNFKVHEVNAYKHGAIQIVNITGESCQNQDE